MRVPGIDSAENDPAKAKPTSLPEDAVEKLSLSDMLGRLEQATETKFCTQAKYETFAASLHMATGNTEFFYQLSTLRDQLAKERVVGKIRGVEAWADGTNNFNHLSKSWSSFVDKLYRINIEENSTSGDAPSVLTVQQQAAGVKVAGTPTWVTPNNAYSFIDDLVRTKFVVPFADSVQDVSGQVKKVAENLGLHCYRRYHAKDSGYHAHHVYVLLPVPGPDDSDIEVAFEIKVLTKLQDTLGELTHLLYERKRTGRLSSEKKRKLAWQFDSPDFNASYVGHSAQYLEASLVKLKSDLALLERN